MSVITDNCNSIIKRINIDNIDAIKKFPKFFEIETIRACNARCSFCSIKDWRYMGCFVMPDNIFEKFCEEISHYSDWINTVCLNRDGEPTLDKKISEKVNKVKEKGIKKVTLSTNAELLTEGLVKKLIESGLDDIMISLDGFTEQVYNAIRIGLNFDTVVANTKNLFKIRDSMGAAMSIRVRMVIVDSNKHEVEEWLAFWKRFAGERDRVYAMPAHNWGNQVNVATNKGACFNENACIFPFSSMAIHVNGDVGICNADYNATIKMGNILNDTIKTIWNNEEYEKIRKIHLEGNKKRINLCNECNIWERNYIESEHVQTKN